MGGPSQSRERLPSGMGRAPVRKNTDTISQGSD